METTWSLPWNIVALIEHYFKGIEEVLILVTRYPPKYTMNQTIGKAKTAIETCDLFPTHLNELSGFTPANQDWGNLNSGFGEAYKNLPIAGPGMGIPGTITNTQGLSDGKDKSIITIAEGMGTLRITSNVNA